LFHRAKDKCLMADSRKFPKERFMRSRENNPNDESIDQHVERALARRNAYVGELIADGGAALGRALKRLGAVMQRGYDAELDRRAVEADAFLRRSVPRY